MQDDGGSLYGKFRGSVVDDADPLGLGRVCVSVPDAGVEGWAMPCVPTAGPGAGIYAPPAVGALVWVEFERGDPGHPIVAGCFWGSAGQVPEAAGPAGGGITFQTPAGHTIRIADMPGPAGGILLRTAAGATIALGEAGIRIDNGKGAAIVLAGPAVTVEGLGTT